MSKFEGKVAIVTGGASGIGEATARLFANHGVKLVVIADINDDLGHKVATSIGIKQCSYFHCDVSDEDQVKSMVDYTVQKFGHLDIMFSNAGIINPHQNIVDLDLFAAKRLLATNVFGNLACVKHATRVMIEGGNKGSIVCTGSIAASSGQEKFFDYSISKHAILGLVRATSRELGSHGIRINCVSPGALSTPLARDVLEMDTEMIEKIFSPLTCLTGSVLKTNNIADAVIFLASDESAFVTGQNLVVDGGYLSC
ncbi:hypothetical protein GIB67_024423 [Kingdonia uniflora]|uniref:Secoisolariciresinol dehydrogenase n=1 Tax=Kingdonia uniflora TaxID=39325 RepID=A0A7J7P4P7_9MAGN|nr:hypothetical protein GIB67_024423 [Kingdonia uniflora]